MTDGRGSCSEFTSIRVICWYSKRLYNWKCSRIYIHVPGIQCSEWEKYQEISGSFSKIFVLCNFMHVKPTVFDMLNGHKNVVSQDRWTFVSGLITLKCRTFCHEYLSLSKQVVCHGSVLSRKVSLYCNFQQQQVSFSRVITLYFRSS